MVGFSGRSASGRSDRLGRDLPLGKRYYDPYARRWTQPDPIDIRGSLTSANKFIYVGDDPVNLVDPSGMSFLSKAVAVGGTLLTGEETFAFAGAQAVAAGACFVGTAGLGSAVCAVPAVGAVVTLAGGVMQPIRRVSTRFTS
jgi:RHS repeat-associated protein